VFTVCYIAMQVAVWSFCSNKLMMMMMNCHK